MQQWIVIFAWCGNVLVVSLALAIFEIVLERHNGWGSGLNPSGWGRKLFGESIISQICEKPYFTVYHLFTFLFIVPVLLVGELLLVNSLEIGHPVYSYLFLGSKPHFVMQVGEVRLIPLLFLTAGWLSILVVEDVLWFALNWHYPKSWAELLSGNIWWHTRWLNFGSIKLPRFYVTTQLLASAFLMASLRFGG